MLAARRMVEGLSEVEILEDVMWDPLINKWVLLCKLSPNFQSNGTIPVSTDWYVHIDDSYPWGSIRFYPAKTDGLKGTFPHQNYNGTGRKEAPWTTGNLCLDNSYSNLRHLGLDTEPFDSERRLLWHFERAINWLIDANEDKLINPGDPFELPDFNKGTLNTIAFCESPETFSIWRDSKRTYGIAELVFFKKEKPYIMVPKKFATVTGEVVFEAAWGAGILGTRSESDSVIAGWVFLKDVPIIPPWQAPMTWSELISVCRKQGIELLQWISKIVPLLRDGKAHIFLFGFPIPDRVQESPKQVFWQPIHLPKLSNVKNNLAGFRSVEKYNWYRDTKRIFGTKKPINWLNAENWHESELFNRGRINKETRNSFILQLGAGAVGSMVAELLVRGGQKDITIMDDDLLQAGNIVRHTLTMKEILKFKVDSLTERLNQVSPHSNVTGIRERFSSKANHSVKPDDYDIILDCTGEDETLYHLTQVQFKETKTFLSISLGFGAKRLFVFYSSGKAFSQDAFTSLMRHWIESEQKETSEVDFPREGLGCWHPIFPARSDDVWLMVTTAIKSMERAITTKENKPKLLVYEQQWEGDLFKGVMLVSQEEYDE
ncbi:ThiF family adenylyltransferase [Bacillus sp. EB01]|uniref:ThiF family adenylyltransferase n=1 Tax=Bacillus sp. EB01 TaxID=1347086 RepID=UPI002F35D3D8